MIERTVPRTVTSVFGSGSDRPLVAGFFRRRTLTLIKMPVVVKTSPKTGLLNKLSGRNRRSKRRLSVQNV